MTNEMQDRLEKDDNSNRYVENDVLVNREIFAKSRWSQASQKAFHH